MQKKISITMVYDSEKLRAIQKYAAKKDVDVDAQLSSFLQQNLDAMFRKFVPKNVREFLEEDIKSEVEKAPDPEQKNDEIHHENSEENHFGDTENRFRF